MDEAFKRQRFLDGRHFSASVLLAAVGMTAHTHGNYISKSPLELCSPPTGQGRARRYCLIDVYQIALLDILATMTGQVAFCAEVLNYNLFLDTEMLQLASELGYRKRPVDSTEPSTLDELYTKHKDLFCDTIFATPQCYHHRDVVDPFYLMISEFDIRTNRRICVCMQKADLGFLDRTFSAGILINITAQLAAVDRALAASAGWSPTNA